MNRSQIKRPIDSFIDYFIDIKPYHTKILEVVEEYTFAEPIDVTLFENMCIDENWGNVPLCKPVGYGLDFDDDCGFSASSCCNLFSCEGGYGLIFDNSDLLVSAPILEHDDIFYTVTIPGDHRYDRHYQIAAIDGKDTIRILGDVTSELSHHALFVVAPKNIYDIQETISNGFYITGNKQKQFNEAKEFSVINSTQNDNRYSTFIAKYFPRENRTLIKVFPVSESGTPNVPLNQVALGSIVIASGTKNNGLYQRISTSFDGQYTNIILHPSTQLPSVEETAHGSVVIRTALRPNRRVRLVHGSQVGSEAAEIRISNISYDDNSKYSTVTLIAPHTVNDPVYDLSTATHVELYGYIFGAGFDGDRECSLPKPHHVYATFTEVLEIQVI